MQQLAGYFEKEDGTIYPATIQTISDKLTPNSTALLYAWTLIPQAEETENMKLVVGKVILEKGAGEDAQSKVAGFVNPYAFKLPAESAAIDQLQGIEIEPFKLSFNRIRTQINFEQARLKLEFDYDLQQDLLTKADYKDQKIVVELKDANGKSVFSKAFNIRAEETENSLNLGEHTAEVIWTDEKFVMNIQTLKEFDFNVYHEYQPGYRQLLATQKLPWLVERTLSN
jgi:hypothetical protein